MRRVDGGDPAVARGGEADAAAQVDDVRVLGELALVQRLPRVEAVVCKLIDGGGRDRHDEGMQEAAPSLVAKVVDPRVRPVRVVAYPLDSLQTQVRSYQPCVVPKRGSAVNSASASVSFSGNSFKAAVLKSFFSAAIMMHTFETLVLALAVE